MKYIDSHCHISSENFDNDREDYLKILHEKMDYILEVGTDIKTSEESFLLSQKSPIIYFSCGIHPTETENAAKDFEIHFDRFKKSDKLTAIGEIGLDFHWDTDRQKQYMFLDMQMNYAAENKLPVIYHVRDAYDEIYEFFKNRTNILTESVIHCFSSDSEHAKKFLDMGFYLGFDGPITYPKNNDLRAALKYTPMNRILIETDSPYLPPVPFRGKRNQPDYVEYIYKKICEVKETEESKLAYIHKENFENLFLKK